MSNIKFPVIPLRGMTVFPNMVANITVGRERSVAALEAAGKKDEIVFLVLQKDSEVNEPRFSELYNIGTAARVKQVLKLPGDNAHVIVEGISRGRLESLHEEEDCVYAEISYAERKDREDYSENIHVLALMEAASDKFEEHTRLNGKNSSFDAVVNVVSAKTPGVLADIITAALNIGFEEKQELLEILEPVPRLESVIQILNRQVEVLKVKAEISAKVKAKMEENQREYYLREQLKIISEELGDKDGIKAVSEGFKKAAEERKLPDYAINVINKESDRLSKMSIATPEANVIRNYVEFILDLPWNEASEEIFNLKKSAEILEEDHYGLTKVKERIIEYLAVRQNTKETGATIICLAGPPGVGKTSIAKSVAKATGRNYVRMSLGGVKDESEIRGHRRTYVGAMSGRILNVVRQAKTINPLILLDEVDKLSVSYNGDPASALLEVLDGEQNNNFRDHFLEIPYDLSKVLFLCTANDVGKIPIPLRDRMEIIYISSYTSNEKVHIAMEHLYPKQLKLAGLKKGQLKIDEETMAYIIENYTKEAGVRSLERTIEKVCRKAVKEIISNEKKSVKITKKNIEKYLGKVVVRPLCVNEKPQVGIVRGLAWTSVGGDTLEVEVNAMKGSGKIELTGNMGGVMKESAKAAVTYLRSVSENLKLDTEFYKNTDIHIHIPQGAVPKDGPSAGITMATALVSALTKVPVRNDVAMTGEITITGRVLAIGGLKEKTLAAKYAGITTVILPEDNKSDLEEIEDEIKDGLKFVLVKNVNEVFQEAVIEGESIWK